MTGVQTCALPIFLEPNFIKALNQYKIKLDDPTKKLIYNLYDDENDGRINCDKFIATLIGSLSPFRKTLVDELFSNLNSENTNELDKNIIIDCYNPLSHPLVTAKRLSKDSAILDFQVAINNYLWIVSEDPKLTTFDLPQFEDFFRYVSASLEKDSDFELVACNCWNYPDIRKTEKDKKLTATQLKPPFDINNEPTDYVTTKEFMASRTPEKTNENLNAQKIFIKLKHHLQSNGIRKVFAFQKSLKDRKSVV